MFKLFIHILLIITRWFFGVVFILAFFASISTNFISSIASLCLGIMLIKPLAQIIYKRLPYALSTKFLFMLGILFFVVAIFSNSKNAAQKTVKSTPRTTPPSVFVTATKIPITKGVMLSATSAIIKYPTSTPTMHIDPTVIPTTYSIPTSYTVPTTNTSAYYCDCSKTCTQISSCAEAQYQLNTCGCAQRDNDHDGIACDSAPLNCQK